MPCFRGKSDWRDLVFLQNHNTPVRRESPESRVSTNYNASVRIILRMVKCDKKREQQPQRLLPSDTTKLVTLVHSDARKMTATFWEPWMCCFSSANWVT